MNKNPFNEYRATHQQVQERTEADCEGMVCKKCGDTYGNPTEGSCMYDSKDPNGKNWMQSNTEATDPVNKKELKGKHKDRKDKDIDNDGDVDASDQYLHNRRKAISKATEDTNKEGYYKDMVIKKQDKAIASKKKKQLNGGKEGDVTMNPTMDSEKKTEQKESRIRTALKSVLSERKENHSPNQEKGEKIGDNLKGQGAKDMMAAADDAVNKGPEAHLNEPEIDKKNFQNMTKNVPSKKMRKNDNPKGDTKIVPGGTQFKDPAAMKPEQSVTKADDGHEGGFMKKESYDKMSGLKKAYASMYAQEIEEAEQLDELSPELLHRAADKQSKRTTRIGSLASKQAAAGRNSDKADKMYDKSKARQDRLRKGANAAGDRDAEKAYQANKGK